MLKDNAINQIKEVMGDSIDSKYLAGVSILVMKDNKEIFYHEDGYANIEKNTKIQRNSIFRLYSMSKPITAVAVMILFERGLIDLYSPVSTYLKGFENQKVVSNGDYVDAYRPVMIKDLLSMVGGLVYPNVDVSGKATDDVFKELDSRLFSDNQMTTLELANKIGNCPLAFQPGTNWQYGTSADILGAIVEIVSGKTFGEFLKTELFEPLDMVDTGFWVVDEKRDRLVTTYQDNGNGGLEVYKGNNLGINNLMDRPPLFESGGAGLVSTIDDYEKFATMLINKGKYGDKQILRPKTVKYLGSQTLTNEQQKGIDTWVTLAGYSYGNLMRVLTDDTKSGDLGSIGEYGWDGWLGPYLCNAPKDNLTILLMMQKTDAGTTTCTRKIRNIIFSALSE